ncbi:nitrite reductase/ring-hydroxylating ferredoxin subunit [Bradyrhizobium elkanii]
MARHVIAPVDELPPGSRKFLEIDGRPIAVFNVKGEFFGLLNRCPHQGAALCEGPLIGLASSSDPGEIEYTKLGEILRCPWHGWEFDIRTGQSYCDPRRFRVRAYPVSVEPGTNVVKGPYVAETIKVAVGERLRGGGFVAATVPKPCSPEMAIGERHAKHTLAGVWPSSGSPGQARRHDHGAHQCRLRRVGRRSPRGRT